MPAPGEKKRVIVLCNRFRRETIQAGQDLVEWLSPKANIVAHNLMSEINLAEYSPVDYCIILGGDGSILSTVRNLKDKQIPIIGVNMGKLGFLAEFTLAQLKEHWQEVITRQYLISRRIMLNCEITGPNRKKMLSMAVNEVAVIAGPPFRMIEVTIYVGGELLAVSAGDGLIVSTPTGSTAYNLSAGGPILEGTIQAAVITPLAAHSLSFRPIVVPMDAPIVIHCQNRTHDFSGPSGVIVVDGQENVPVNQEDEITITRANASFFLIRNPHQGPWELLNTKLNWGALPNYDSDGSV